MKDAEVIEAKFREALEYYADQYCEMGHYDEGCGKYDEEICGGCKARAALTTPTPHDGLTDTSHHAENSAGEMVLVPRDLLGRAAKFIPSWYRELHAQIKAALAASPAPPHQGGR